MSNSQGNFVWYELVTNDVKGAIRFYEDVIGWGTQAFEGGDAPYTMWTAGGTPVGGVMPSQGDGQGAGAKPHWFAHVLADDVDALAKKAQSLGGKIEVPPRDIPTVGRFSIIADPQGAIISLFTPKGSGAPQGAEPANGHFSWHELMAGDMEAAFRFYSQLFGWQKTQAIESPMGVYQMYGKDGRTLGGMATKPKDYPAPPHWLYYVKVADLDGALARVKKDGGQVMHGPMEVPGGDRVAQCTDPQGAAFALHGK
jgi:predicted enzyme related to lactoylglutathione lyase